MSDTKVKAMPERIPSPGVSQSTSGISRLFVHTTTVRGMAGYDYWDEDVAVLRAGYSHLTASEIRGAEGLQAPTLDIDHRVSVEQVYESLSGITIHVPARGYQIRSVMRALAAVGLMARGTFEWKFGPRGFARYEAVYLQVAAPVRVVESSSGRHHVFIDHAMTTKAYQRLLRALARAGVVEKDWAWGAPGWTCVRTPGSLTPKPKKRR